MGYHQHLTLPSWAISSFFPEFPRNGQECLFPLRQGQIILFLYFIHSIAGQLHNPRKTAGEYSPCLGTPYARDCASAPWPCSDEWPEETPPVPLQPRKPFPGQIPDIPRHAQNVVPHNRGNLVPPVYPTSGIHGYGAGTLTLSRRRAGLRCPVPLRPSLSSWSYFSSRDSYMLKALQKGFRS